jgi:type IX secretion system substrate protein/galactose oxidase-like protein
MKTKTIFFLFSCILQFPGFICFSQAGEWVWMRGSNTPYNNGNHGTLGVPGPTVNPPALYEACEWTDLNGNFWLYGGTDGSQNVHNDLFKYDPVAGMWTWMSGTNTVNDAGDYGTQGVPSSSNRPPARGYGYASWVDLNGNLWMFGGDKSAGGAFSDLWKYDITGNVWTWMKGPNITNQAGVYGIQGIPAPANNPGARWECGISWTDTAGDLWLFGGLSYGTYNDLWRYNIASNNWTWMKGSQLANQPGTYGIKGIEVPSNTPGAREAHCKWEDNNGNLWLFGGQFTDFASYVNYNDLWRFNPATNNWAWINGDSAGNGSGSYGTKCLSLSANQPPAKLETRAAWTDAKGNLWMFGGGIDPFEVQVTNDLWRYCIASNQWTWESGDSLPNPAGNWGTMGVPSPSNKPNGRGGSNGWADPNGHLYLFGGTAAVTSGIVPYNDLWQYTIDTICGECPEPNAMKDNNPLFNKLLIFPNPAGSFLTLSFESLIKQTIALRIYNTLGKQVYFSEEEITKGKFEREIDVKGFPAGIYFLQVKIKAGLMNKKVVVNHF